MHIQHFMQLSLYLSNCNSKLALLVLHDMLSPNINQMPLLWYQRRFYNCESHNVQDNLKTLIFVNRVRQVHLKLNSINNIIVGFGLLCVMSKQQLKISYYIIAAFLTINNITTTPRLGTILEFCKIYEDWLL